jgi:hypothetical protein
MTQIRQKYHQVLVLKEQDKCRYKREKEELDQFQNFYTMNKEELDKMLELSKDELLTIRKKINKNFDILKGMRDMVLSFNY